MVQRARMQIRSRSDRTRVRNPVRQMDAPLLLLPDPPEEEDPMEISSACVSL